VSQIDPRKLAGVVFNAGENQSGSEYYRYQANDKPGR